jgi:hypothetical protein
VALAACSEPDARFSHDPIPLTLAGGTQGGLVTLGATPDRPMAFPMLLDTASPVTAYQNGTSTATPTRATLTLYGNEPTGEVPRVELPDIQMFVTPLGGSGLDQWNPIAGVIGGDNLQRFVLGLSYVPAPAITLTDKLVLDDCDLSERCGAVLPFSLAGGKQAIDIGQDVFSYPASYVLLDACLEPALDPLEPTLPCRDRGCLVDCTQPIGTTAHDTCVNDCNAHRIKDCGGDCHDCDDPCANPANPECQTCLADADHYLPHGIDVRFAVATGFPGLALTASAYDRLRGAGAASMLIGAGGHSLYLPDQSIGGTGLTVGLDQLGSMVPADRNDATARSALALVGRTGYFGPCAELARARRLRAVDPKQNDASSESCLRSPKRNPNDTLLQVCKDQNSDVTGVCDDRGDSAHVAAYAELEGQIPIIVVPNTTALLQNINADVRPDSATVEGVIGTELLRHLGATIDYPSGRFVATCADDSCRVFPQWGHGTDCQDPAVSLRLPPGQVRTFQGGGCAVP